MNHSYQTCRRQKERESGMMSPCWFSVFSRTFPPLGGRGQHAQVRALGPWRMGQAGCMTVGMIPQWKGLEVTAHGYRSHPCAACFPTLACLSLASHAARWGSLHFTTEQTASQSPKVTHPPAGTPRPEPRREGCSGSGRRRGSGWSRRTRRTAVRTGRWSSRRGRQGRALSKPLQGVPLPQGQRELGETQAT